MIDLSAHKTGIMRVAILKVSSQLILFFLHLQLFPSILEASSPVARDPDVKTPIQLAVREFFLKPYQESKIREDLPVNSAFLEQNQTLWFTGKTSLWKWNFHSNKLQKISVPDLNTDSHLNQSQILVRGQKVFIARSDKLWQVSFNPLKVIQYKAGPDYRGSKSHQLSQENDHILWTLTRGLILINSEQQKLKPWIMTDQFKPSDQLLYQESASKIWVLRNSSLLYLNTSSSLSRLVPVVTLDQSFLGMSIQKDRLMAYTAYSVLALNGTADIMRTIPVEGQSKIFKMALSPFQHHYLFQNHSMEIFRTDSKKIYHARFDQTAPLDEKKVSDFQSWNSILTFVSNGKPRVFQLEGVW